MDTKTIESLDDRIATLECNLKQLEAHVSRIFADPGESFQ